MTLELRNQPSFNYSDGNISVVKSKNSSVRATFMNSSKWEDLFEETFAPCG